jgi:hypothetical protein
VTVTGPFPPGTTNVQVGFQLPPGERVRVRLALPADMLQPTVIAEKAGGTMSVESPQLPGRQEANDGGKVFVLAAGPALKAGQVFEFDVTGIPHHPVWPRNVALALALVLLGVGAWAALRRGGTSGEAAARRVLERRREAIFEELVRLERQRKKGEAGEGSDERRGALVAELEKIYGELDSTPAARNDQGFAA